MRIVCGALLLLAGLTVIGGLVGAYLTWTEEPVAYGMVGAFVITMLAGLAHEAAQR